MTPADTNLTIPMMGMSFSQHSMLAVNNGTNYINTAVSEARQKASTGGPVPITSVNVFQSSKSYYIFFVYANERTKQEYQMYIGTGISAPNVTPVRVDIRTQALKFQEGVTWNGLKLDYNPDTGILTVTADFSEFASNFAETRGDYCQPKDFCALVSGKCQSPLDTTDPLYAESQRICETIAGKDVDYPLFQFSPLPPGMPNLRLPGCIGFKVTLGDTGQFAADDLDHRPAACFPKQQQSSPWDVSLKSALDIAGTCNNTLIPNPQFCNQTCP
jgi:hypothetical protein